MGSIPIARSFGVSHAAVAQLVECVLGKDEVMGSSPISSSWWVVYFDLTVPGVGCWFVLVVVLPGVVSVLA